MHPNDIRKAKALVWYWLNNHPAEVYRSPTELHSSNAQGTLEDYNDLDMIIENSRTGWSVGSGLSEVLMSYHQDPDRWHDVNKVICAWFGRLWEVEKGFAFDYLRAVKGEPISRWKFKYTRLPAPDWVSLVRGFQGKGYIEVDINVKVIQEY